MKVINIELSRELENIELVPFADLHLGDQLCDIELIQEKINYVKDHKNVYCILNGDILNNSTKSSVGDVYSEKLTPMEQLQRAADLFDPIKDKILLVTNGNHEARTWRTDGIDLMKIFCRELKIDDKYANESALLFIRFGTLSSNHKESKGTGKLRMACYTMYVSHGTGGGRKEGGKINSLADMAAIVDADIYVHSHTHLPLIMKQAFYRTDTRNSTAAIVDKLFVNTNSFLNYGGYGETFGFKPNSKEVPHIFLCGTKKISTARL